MNDAVPVDLTLWKNRGETLAPPADPQVQCPNCGGYRVTKVWLRGPLEPVRDRGVSVLAWLGYWFSFLWSTLVLIGLFFLTSPYFRDILFRRRYRVTQQVIGYTCTCQLCGLRFVWKFADPHPPIQPRANLVRLGAEKLRREEEERRHRQEEEDQRRRA